jgi:hypothetical protein
MDRVSVFKREQFYTFFLTLTGRCDLDFSPDEDRDGIAAGVETGALHTIAVKQ